MSEHARRDSARSRKRAKQIDAFLFYVALGAARSYKAVADEYGISARAVSFLAKRFHWKERLDEMESRTMERLTTIEADTIADARARHLASLRLLQNKAVRGIVRHDARSLGEARRALVAGIKMERTVLGHSDPTHTPPDETYTVDADEDGTQ